MSPGTRNVVPVWGYSARAGLGRICNRDSRPGFVLLVRPNDGAGRRFGITVTKRIGNAVVRNRMKRRFRALLREMLPEQGMADADHVLIGREGGVERDFAQLRLELSAALARAAAGKGDAPRSGRGRPKGKGAGPGGGNKPRAETAARP